jgi:hypothetical protein
MHVEKKILTDESMKPVAVQIAYDDWLEIERQLERRANGKTIDPARHAGTLSLGEDPAEFQARLREEWM